MIGENDVRALLHEVGRGIAVPAIPAPTILVEARWRTRRRRVVLVAVALAAVLAGAGAWGPLTRGHGGSSAASGTCPTHVPAAVLPGWATAGFSDPKSPVPYVSGDRGDIIAILFAQPLTSPPAAGRGNKILWVSQLPASTPGDLNIEASLGPSLVTRTVPGGPGPSLVDLPRAGCWHLTLRWGGHIDTMSLLYSKP